MLDLKNSSLSLPKINFMLPDGLGEPMNDGLLFGNKKLSRQKQPNNTFILIFGNDEDTRLLFKTALELWNYEVAEAEDIKQLGVIAALKCPDLVLMDTGIDIDKSLETMNDLKSRCSFNQTGIFLISGHAQESVKETALNAGADDFFVQPIDFNYLQQSILNFLNNKQSKINFEK